jgi:lipopolysaccharide export LptBFGC system permease protein LptF
MDKNEKALKHAQNVWGIYFDDIDEDCNSTKGENSQIDYLAGYNQCEQDNNKLKQEHAEMVEFLQKEFDFIIYCRDNMKVSRPVFNQKALRIQQLLNKIKENGN